MKSADIHAALREDSNTVFALKPNDFDTTFVRVRGLKARLYGLWSCTHATHPLTGEWREVFDVSMHSRDIHPVDEIASLVQQRREDNAETLRLYRVAADAAAALREHGIAAHRVRQQVIVDDVDALLVLLKSINA